MNAQIQNTNFTHGKCTRCGHLALLDKFEQTRINEVKNGNDDGCRMEMYQLVLTCPICGDAFCEALFPNELN
jgi:hypothetical protein